MAIGITYSWGAAEATVSTNRISPVAYATELSYIGDVGFSAR